MTPTPDATDATVREWLDTVHQAALEIERGEPEAFAFVVPRATLWTVLDHHEHHAPNDAGLARLAALEVSDMPMGYAHLCIVHTPGFFTSNDNRALLWWIKTMAALREDA